MNVLTSFYNFANTFNTCDEAAKARKVYKMESVGLRSNGRCSALIKNEIWIKLIKKIEKILGATPGYTPHFKEWIVSNKERR